MDNYEEVEDYIINKDNPEKDRIKKNIQESIKTYDTLPIKSFVDKKDADKSDTITSNLKSITKGMNAGDWVWLLGTIGLALANPKGRGAQAKVIQHNLDESRKYSQSMAKQALSRVKNTILPALQQNKKDVIEMRNYMINNLKGVSPKIINNLAKAGPTAIRKFMQDLDKINAQRAKFKTDGIDNPQPKLTGDEINKLFVHLDNMEESPIDFGTTEDSRRKAINELLDDTYNGYTELLEVAETAKDLDYGLFGAAYGNPKTALKDAARYLKRFGSFSVGDTLLDMAQLDKLSISDIGLDPAKLKSIDYDITKGAVDTTNLRIDKALGEKMKMFFGNVTEEIITDNISMFGKLGEPLPEDNTQLKKDERTHWSGDVADLQGKFNGRSLAPLHRIATESDGLFTLLYNQALLNDYKNRGTGAGYNNIKSLIRQFKEANNDYRASNTNRQEYEFIDVLATADIHKDTIFASEDIARIYATIMKRSLALNDSTELTFHKDRANPASEKITKTIAQLLGR